MDFTDYTLAGVKATGDVRDLANGTVWAIADTIDYEFNENRPVAEQIQEMIDQIGNMSFLPDFQAIAAEWLETSGMLQPLVGAFKDPSRIVLPSTVDTLVVMSGTADSTLHRMMRALKPVTVVLGGGEYFLAKRLSSSVTNLFSDTTVVVGNGLSVIQDAAQIREAIRLIDNAYDRTEIQLFMVSDSVALPPFAKSLAINQRWDGMVKALLRSALYLQRAIDQE